MAVRIVGLLIIIYRLMLTLSSIALMAVTWVFFRHSLGSLPSSKLEEFDDSISVFRPMLGITILWHVVRLIIIIVLAARKRVRFNFKGEFCVLFLDWFFGTFTIIALARLIDLVDKRIVGL